MTNLTELLAALAPYVWVVGSHARGTAHAGSDIDLAPRLRPDHDPDAERTDPRSRERLMPEIIDVLDRHHIEWASPSIGYIVAVIDGTLLEVCELMDNADTDTDPAVHPVTIADVPMTALDPALLHHPQPERT